MLKRFVVDNSLEDKILMGIITSEEFCRKIAPAFDQKLFTSPFAQIVSEWGMDYYNSYKKAAQEKIQDVFEVESGNIKPEEAEIISQFLSKLSSQFEQEENFNVEYLLDKSLLYFRKQSLKKTIERVDAFLELDKIEDAEKEWDGRKNIYKATSGWIDPFQENKIKDFFIKSEDRSQILFEIDKAFGKLIGPFERNWLASFFAPAKRGKTFMLQEIAIQALLEKLRVVFISLEMDSQRIIRRIYKRLTALGDQTADYIYPCFDCAKNQDDSCDSHLRTNHERLLDQLRKKPSYSKDMTYRPCTACRGTSEFIPDSWYTVMNRKKMNSYSAVPKLNALRTIFKNNFRVQSYPAYSANLSRIKNELDILEFSEDFIPDVIVIDYADILAPEDGRVIGRERIDETWKALKNISDSRHCLVLTASQTNRNSFDKKNVTQIDAAEDIRKIAHIDLGLAINQLPEEKRAGIVRIAKIAGRDSDFDQYQSVMVLQQLALGQANLDSEFVIERREENDINQEEI
jgi:archaellum biogenesis ATPase FlaH